MKVDRKLLPMPVIFYSENGIVLHGSGPWRSAKCPFHDDQKPSLRVMVSTGAFRCMACGARGGDLIDFHMQLHGLDFKSTIKALGAWDDKS